MDCVDIARLEGRNAALKILELVQKHAVRERESEDG